MWLAVAVICLIQQATCSEPFGRHLNPESFMTIPEIIESWGYPSEKYDVQTDDGYFVQINRIPHGLHSPRKKGPNPAVLLVPGVMADAKYWIINLLNNSIGFALADAGYDVWMLNCRGIHWSNRHQNLSIEQEEYWDFSFHETGTLDVPAVIKFILMKTEQEALYVIGHSQGATLGLVTFSVIPELAKRVKLLMLLAPPYTLLDTGGPIQLFLSLPAGLKRLIWGNKAFCPHPKMMRILLAHACSFPMVDKICVHFLSMFFGFNKKNLNTSRIDVYISGAPDCTSLKTMIHWGQVIKSGEFKYFDYGSENNARYNTTTPPLYKLEDIRVPTALWSAGNDMIANVKDVELLLPRLTHLVSYQHFPSWQHADFVLGLDAPKKLYPSMFWLMEQYK